MPAPTHRQQGASLHVAGARRVDAFRAAAPRARTPRTATRARILDSVAERPRYDETGDHYEEDSVKPIALGARRPPRVADKPVLLFYSK